MICGDVVSSKNWGDAVILEIGKPKIVVQFLNTGNIVSINRVACYNGLFSDGVEKSRLKAEAAKAKEDAYIAKCMARSWHGVGYTGIGKYGRDHTEYRTLWQSMLRRCYTKYHPAYEGCTVCDRWHNFQNFCEDIQTLHNFDKWSEFKKGKGGRNLYCLDKDVLEEGNKEYSPGACQFITHSENVTVAMTGGRIVYRFVKDYELIEVPDLKLWCEENDLNQGAFRQLLQGNSQSSQGYVLYNPEISLTDHYNPGILKERCKQKP